jgi:hypothetical protein
MSSSLSADVAIRLTPPCYGAATITVGDVIELQKSDRPELPLGRGPSTPIVRYFGALAIILAQ